MKKIKHPFFDQLKEITKRDMWNAFEGAPFPKREFYKALREAHPIVFDSRCTEEGIQHAGIEVDHIVKIPSREQEAEMFERQHKAASKVEEFSLPFATSLYLLTNCQTIVRNAGRGSGVKAVDHNMLIYKRIGYLLREISPEKIRVFDLMIVKPTQKRGEERFFPVLDFLDIDLKNPDPNLASDTLSINRFTNMISVKRIGIERRLTATYRDETSLTKYTVAKYDNVIHIADKEEYEYTPLGEDSNVEFNYTGFWRGHWRAFYYPDTITDSFGRRVVDYTRVGKCREGTYNVPGYTWVKEHIKGDPTVAEIKTRVVKHG